MAELLRKKIDDHTVYAIWKITESVEELRTTIKLREPEDILYQSFVAESRKKQWLAYRLLIRALLKPEDFPVEYDQSGKPYLAGSDFHISVTHTEDLAAVIISRYNRVGIDIEKVKPRIEKVKDKFMGTAEMASIRKDRDLEQMTIAWCAKEALYKMYGARNLDFRENIKLDIPACAGEPFTGEILIAGKRNKYQLFSEMIGDFVLVYLMEPLI
jgi:phosphopantetheinyl transferase